MILKYSVLCPNKPRTTAKYGTPEGMAKAYLPAEVKRHYGLSSGQYTVATFNAIPSAMDPEIRDCEAEIVPV